MDPEQKRAQELAQRVKDGQASAAEVEELALYAEADSQMMELVHRAGQEQELGGEWLVRAQADQRLVAAEQTPWTVAERRAGVGMLVGGVTAAFFFPPAIAVAGLGVALLAWSVVRVKIKTAGQDPYDGIEQ